MLIFFITSNICKSAFHWLHMHQWHHWLGT